MRRFIARLTGADRWLFGLVTVGLLGLYVRYWSPDGAVAGERVRISSPAGVEVVPLAGDRTLELDGPLGRTRIEIHDGRIRFVASPCRGKQCLHAGWLHATGEFAACLPNRISLTVLGRLGGYDSINF